MHFTKQQPILWLQPQEFSGGLRRLAHAQMRVAGVSPNLCKEYTLPNKWKNYTGKKKWEVRPEAEAWINETVEQRNPQLIIVNSDIALAALTNDKYHSLAVMRGSVLHYHNTFWSDRKIPALVVDSIRKFHTVKWGPWIIQKDFEKLRRFINHEHRAEVRFAYKVCQCLADVRRVVEVVERALLLSIDIETTGQGARAQISSVSYTVWQPDGNVHTWVIPFVYTCTPSSRFWSHRDTETAVWALVRKIHDSRALKVMQNGSYDSCYFIKHRAPLRNYLVDTAHIFHSLWPEAPKRLDFVASIACDFYKFWKDEGKEDEKDDDKFSKLPSTPEGYKSYWRYNALDTHYTLLSAQWALQVLFKPANHWALINYIKEMRQVLGPGLAMSMRGVKVNSQLQNVYFHDNMAESQEQLARLRTMVDDDEFNPRSVPQKQRIIYGTLRAKPLPRKGKTTDEKVLNIIRTQSPLLDIIIRQLWAYLKPTNNASKYGAKLQLLNGRWMYKMNAAGTETGRYSSKAHDFWIGTQIQNPPYKIRPMVEADAGYLFWKIDYAKSDAWFTAFESQEPALMAAVSGDKDAHCLHAAQFFKIPYDELEKGWKADDPKITHNVTGIRSVTKRVGYGANYLMAGYTLFITMGYEAVVAAAKQLGYKNADNWSVKQLVQLCDYLLNVYFTELYPGLKPWIKNETIQAIARGNKATCHGGQTRTFFGNLSRDQSAQRELAAFFGQGGTAGNINQALENIYWKSDIETRGAMLLLQIHDELNGLVPATNYGLELVREINRLMENKCTIHDRTFVVPTEIEVGFGLGKRLMHWHDGITIQEIREHDRKWWQKEFPNGLAESVTERIAQTAVG